MKTHLIACLTAALFSGATLLPAQEIPQLPPPVKEHEWLQQLVGEWESEMEVFMVPGQPAVKGKGTEVVRMLGGFWMIGEGKGEMMGMKMSSLLTLGYDPEKKKYVGNWVDSMSSMHWTYAGSVDSTGKKLTLETEGPCPMKPGTTSKFKEVLEIKDKDHKVFTSSILGEDGKWTTMVVVNSTRKK